MNAIFLLIAVASTLVLHSGDRIAVDGPIHEEKGVITFRSGGVLYTLPAVEVVRVETEDHASEVKPARAAKPAEKPKRLLLSEEERKKRIEELEKNHSGTPAPPSPMLENPPPPPSAGEVAQQRSEEWEWRHRARDHEEAVRRAGEELQLIEERIEQLRARILSFVSLGYKPRQFTYDSTELVRAEEQIPYARLQVERAQRANEQFREDARRQGILPGWLR